MNNAKKEFFKIWGDTNFTCWRCMTVYNCLSAAWIYNDVLKRKLIACPECKCQVQVNR